MSSQQRKPKKGKKKPNAPIYPRALVQGMKAGDMEQLGDDIYVIPVFVLDPPEPIANTGRRKPKNP